MACHCECGVLVHVVDGRVVKIEGDPDHPQNEGMMCPKGLSYIQVLYHPDRLKYPLKRIGAKGEGKWKRITWNEAYEIIASKIKEIKEKYGSLSIAWGWGDTRGPSVNLWMDWLYSLGSPNVFHSDASYCFQPTLIADISTYGAFITSEVGPDYRNSKCILVWGGNPVASHPTRARDIILALANGAKLIVVDPRFTEMASKADLFLQVRPATDAALALSMLNVIINEELYNHEFVNKWCLGFEKLKKHIQRYTPDWASKITWVPKEDILEAARIFATTKPASLHMRQGVQLNTNNVQTARAVTLILALTGNIDVKGGNLLPLYPKGYIPTREHRNKILPKILPRRVEEKRFGAREYPLLSGPDSISYHDCLPNAVVKAMLTGKPYPIKALIVVNDPVMALENSLEVRQALMNLELFVVIDLFMTPTAELADLVLPAASWVERDEIVDNFYPNFISIRQKAIEPVGECKDEKEIVIELAKKNGLKAVL